MKSDILLKADVMAEIAWDPAIENQTRIGVAVQNGVVTLSGQVDTFMQKHAVERAVLSVAGVRGIAMDLEVKLASRTKISDADIAFAAINALRWHSAVPEEGVVVEVDDGHVTLSGELYASYQAISAEQCVRPLVGVKDVVNNIRIRPSVRAGDIAAEITSAFTRHAQRQAKAIAVRVDGGVVTLQGEVESLKEREAAIGTAWCAKGVTRVIDQLDLSS